MDRQNNSPLLLAAGVGAALMVRAVLRKRRAYDLRGRVALITGGSRGLGLVMARQLAQEGVHLALCARDPDELQRAKDDLEMLGADVFTMPCDVTDRSQAEALVQAVQTHFGAIHILINNAGVIEVGPMETMTLSDYEEAMQTHFWAALYTTLAALPAMRQRGNGRIVNISSIGGKISVPHLLPYCASKFALTGFSEGLRAEVMKDGIFVTTVCPGLMRTGSHRNTVVKGHHRAEFTLFSLMNALPVTSMDARRAARQIITALKRGDAEVVLSIPAQIASAFHALFPGVTADLLGLVNRALPGPGGIGRHRARGSESGTILTSSPLVANIERAARTNNEIG